ncbi:hypothetical protein ACWGMO_18005 [Nocardia salmonicida]
MRYRDPFARERCERGVHHVATDLVATMPPTCGRSATPMMPRLRPLPFCSQARHNPAPDWFPGHSLEAGTAQGPPMILARLAIGLVPVRSPPTPTTCADC